MDADHTRSNKPQKSIPKDHPPVCEASFAKGKNELYDAATIPKGRTAPLEAPHIAAKRLDDNLYLLTCICIEGTTPLPTILYIDANLVITLRPD